MSSDSDAVDGRVGSYIKLRSRKKFAEWKLKTEYLPSKQGCKLFLTGKTEVASE